MLPNGHLLVIDMAVRALDDPLVRRYERALILGALREDIGCIPGLNLVYEKLSITHFYRPGLPGGLIPFLSPGPRMQANRYFGSALREREAGRTAAAFVRLGHAVHLLVDMACPVHAQRVAHETDPYEWYVEAHREELESLPVLDVGECERASDAIEGMSRRTQEFEPDKTHSLWGRAGKLLGVWKPVDARRAGEQARILIPAAAGFARALLRLFLRRAGIACALEGS